MADIQELFSDKSLAPHIQVKIDGSDLPQETVNDLLEIIVENSLHIPDACSIRFQDWDPQKHKFRWVDQSLLREGKQVEVLMGFNKNALKTVFHGEITAIEMDAAGHMTPTLGIKCVSKGHRLHRNRVQKTYQNVTDADIVNQVAGRLGLPVDCDATPEVREWVCQNNQTDWEFLQMLANRNNHRLYIEGNGKLCFKQVKKATDSGGSLEWGLNLRSFRPRISTHGQVSEVMVRGWDPKTKQAIVSKQQPSAATGSAEIGESKKGGELTNSAFGGAKMAVVNWPCTSQAEADALAKSIIDNRETSFVEADGLCYGDPQIKPGKYVDVKKMGERFSGKYYVTSTTHTYTPAEGYTTQFVASGKKADSLVDILQGDPISGRNRQKEHIYGVAVGIVTDNLDPENSGRIKVRFPWLSDEDESWWVRIATPMAGNGRGFMFLPEVDDEVLVAFEHGDIQHPYMIGALWNGIDVPVEKNSEAVSGGVIHRVIKTRKGHIVMLDDEDSKEKVKITTQGGHYICLDDTAGSVNIEMKTTGGHYLKLDDTGKKIELQDSSGTEKMVIDDNAHSIDINCQGNFTLKAVGSVKIEGLQGVEITTPAQVSVKGSAGITVDTPATLTLNGSAGAELKSGAIVMVHGSLVKIN